MKTYRNLIVALAAFSCASLSVKADPAPATPAPSTAAPAPTTNDSTAKKRPSRLDVLAEKLSLTPEQKEKVGIILKDEQAAFKQLKKDNAVPEDAKKAKRREIADAHEAQIRALLTPTQQTSFDQYLDKAHRRDGI